MFSRLELWARRFVLMIVAFVVVAAPVNAQATTTPLTPEAWCALADPPLAMDAKRADSVMAGVIDLGKFGSYSLSADPNWSYQSTTDLAGNRGINSLEWLGPVITEGIARNNQQMLTRARNLIYDWSLKHPVTRPYGDSDQPLISGKRMIALNCAAARLDDPVIKGIAAAEAGRMEAMEGSWGAPNNTDLLGYTGLLFNACFVGDEEMKARAELRLNQVAKSLVNKDGSDIEGSPSYANYTAQLMADALKIMSACNVNPEVVSSKREALLKFVSYTIRPNFTWDTIGDTTAERITTYSNPQPSPLYWAATRGASTPPTDLYSLFPDGGYLFARSAWSADATYYSLRANPRGRTSPHAHDDATSLTFFSQGVQWIADPGPYRYDKSLVRDAITKRSAHSGLAIEGVRTSRKGGFVSSASSAQGDQTCVREDSYPKVTMIRCVEYDRMTNVMTVRDRLIDKRKAKSAAIAWVQRWQVAPDVTVGTLQNGNGFELSAGTARVQLVTDSGAKLTLKPGGSEGAIGLFTTKYGELAPGNTISRRYISRGKVDVTVLTFLVPNGVETLTPTNVKRAN